VNCMPNLEQTGQWGPLPELAPRDVLAERARNRHAAMRYLQAASKTEDVSERNTLRRLAAELVLPR
jgi:hypothetical protein